MSHLAALDSLNRTLLEEKLLGTTLADYPRELLNYPERVIQFGEGNFLRAFVEWMIHEMNKAGAFKGRVVVVQPIAQGRVSDLNAQDGLYTLLLRGVQNGKVVNSREIIPAISRGLDAYSQWREVLKCAEDPQIEFVVSNTTEAGIVYLPGEKLDDTPTCANPPKSYPAKLAVYLYHRFQFFHGDPAKGMVIIPCELIEANGSNLKAVILKLAAEWGLPPEFSQWIEAHNYFLNTLVDRIVTGYPSKDAAKIESELGYHDQNLDTGEIFHLWVIEGDARLADRLPFHKAGLNVKWVTDLTPYRTRKVRILNGAHTSTVAVACLSDIDIVRDAVNDGTVGKFMQSVLFDEIIPTLDSDVNELKGFAKDVLERFNNPFIDHKWFDIALNSTSKFETRVMPSLRRYVEKSGKLPKKLTFSLAALIALYHGTEIRGNKLVGSRNGKEYFIQDDPETLEFFRDNWNRYETGAITLAAIVDNVMHRFWPDFAKQHPQIITEVTNYLSVIVNSGIGPGLKKCS